MGTGCSDLGYEIPLVTAMDWSSLPYIIQKRQELKRFSRRMFKYLIDWPFLAILVTLRKTEQVYMILYKQGISHEPQQRAGV